MNAQQRKAVIKRLHALEMDMLKTKGREYTGGAEEHNELDTLANFKEVARMTGMTPLQCWGVYFMKHISSIMTFISDPSRQTDMAEPIEGRIVDARTYLGLLECLLEEERAHES